jgi:hypothetical protein
VCLPGRVVEDVVEAGAFLLGGEGVDEGAGGFGGLFFGVDAGEGF